MATTYLGTFMYMSPERVRGAEYSYSSDVWSLGLSLFTCSKGNYPFDTSKGYWGLAQAIKDSKFEQLEVSKDTVDTTEMLSTQLNDFIHACLATDDKKRPRIAELLKMPLFMLHRERK
mmetsp:Transcript_16568/g.21181  ORF Transcript_16568/g.21181 Transcript_16568/m.21181 type:complete len:118 (+) Transcript_16568:2-355(+)